MNFLQIIECFFNFCNIRNAFLSIFAVDHSPGSRMILILLTVPILLHRFQWRIVEAMLLFENQPRVSPVCHEALPHSQRIARLHHEGFPHEWNQVRILVSLSKKFHRVAPVVLLSISFPLLRRPSMVIIPRWVACWGETFHKLLHIIWAECCLSVAADIGSPRSFLFLSNCTPGILISITSSPGLLKSRMIRSTAPLQ